METESETESESQKQETETETKTETETETERETETETEVEEETEEESESEIETETDPAPTPTGPDLSMTYEGYLALSDEAKYAFYQTFLPDVQAFFDWYNAAKAAYDAEQERNEIGEGGNVDIGDILGGK